MITTETELPSSQGGVSYSMKIYSMPEGFLTDQEVPVRWRLLGILNGFHINGKDLYASNDWLARQLDCSERSISNGVKELEARGEVYCERTKTSRIIKRTLVDDSQGEGSKRLLPPLQTASIPDSKRLLPISLSNALSITMVADATEDSLPKRKKKLLPEMQSVFDLFTDNPARLQWRLREVEREAAAILYSEYGIEELKRRYEVVRKYHKEPMCPQIHTPSQFLEKMPKMADFLRSLNS